MNIHTHFTIANQELATAQSDVNAGNYSSALIALTRAYPHIRDLIEEVYKLDREKTNINTSPPGGPS